MNCGGFAPGRTRKGFPLTLPQNNSEGRVGSGVTICNVGAWPKTITPATTIIRLAIVSFILFSWTDEKSTRKLGPGSGPEVSTHEAFRVYLPTCGLSII